ncbi:MAG TPA: 1-acyl-sn-glycerol-3-phosphate acyltransferase [Sediminibacterium sp.]|nr:1-acyl-sn-glycerol-3-phosphate acyltransferase [Sediminibacterium sp.]
MIYQLFRKLIKAAIWLFCEELIVVNQAVFATKGPLLVVANHPNSFLDAILIGAQFSGKMHFLARGDAFQQKHHRFLLRLLNMLPVYRLSEGRENLHLNESAFTESRRILAAGGIVLIFIEGICVNSHVLQPFRKGAARIASGLDLQKPLPVLPVAIAYDSLTRFGKKVRIAAGEPIPAKDLLPFKDTAKSYTFFNQQIHLKLESLIQIPGNRAKKPSFPVKFIAVTGWILHFPLYRITSTIIRNKTRGTVFYDSVLFAILLLIYPLYLFLMGCFLFTAGLQPLLAALIILIHPFLARAAVLFARNDV